jgi:hypothetical protein
MDAGVTPGSLHELPAKTFAELGATGPMVRTILLRDRQFAGQRFRCEGMQAVLPAGGNEIEFFDEAGVLLKTVSIKADERRVA